MPQETLVGGWCRVYRHDRQVPLETSVNLGDFNTGRANWKSMPGIMIEKCAMVKALRTAFPAVFSGMYDSAEMGIDMSVEQEPRLPQSPSVTPPTPTHVEEIIIDSTELSQDMNEDTEDTSDEVANVDDQHGEPSPYCVTHQMNFEVMTSQTTGTSKWCHQIEGGGFCVYDGEAPIPSNA